MQTVLEVVKKILRQIPDLKPKMSVDLICPETRFREDLGFDSLAMVSFFYELQDLYPSLDESQMLKWKSVSDCVNSIMVVR
ncbi:MAG: acyl carrier protein [Bdellovibrionales bacterium]|nr:acyl carrier protein [Bdellovibrionales bacterium]